MQTTLLERQNDIALIRINRPPVNAIHRRMIVELTEHFLQLKADEHVRGVMLCGTGAHFSAGLDLFEIYALDESGILEFWRDYDRLIRVMISFPKPLVVALHGHVPAGGCILALCADYRMMAEGTGRIGLNEVPLGMVVPETIYHLYSFVIGRSKAYQYLLEGRMLLPNEALACGLIQDVVPESELEARALDKLQYYLRFQTPVWAQSKLNFRNALLQRIRTDFNTTIAPTLRQWWTSESRAHFGALVEKLRGDAPSV